MKKNESSFLISSALDHYYGAVSVAHLIFFRAFTMMQLTCLRGGHYIIYVYSCVAMDVASFQVIILAQELVLMMLQH